MSASPGILQQALALHQAGNLAAAEVLYRQIISADAGHARAQAMLGLACVQQGKSAEGITLMEAALTAEPRQPDVLNNLGLALQLQQQPAKALARFDQAIALHPDYVSAHFNRANALLDLNRPDEAAASYGQALALKPDYVDAHINLGNAMMELKRTADALTSYERALALMPQRVDILYNRGRALQQLGRYHDAEASYDQAIRLAPDFTEAYANRAALRLDQGQLKEAENDLAQALRLNPDHIASLAMLATLGKVTSDSASYPRLQALFERREQLPAGERIELDFAAGKAWEKAGRYDDAFLAYDEGNRLYRSLHPYREDDEVDYAAWGTRFFSTELLAQTPIPASTDSAGPVPIFIVGMPRSGTTLVEQILASHPAVFGAGELKALGRIAQSSGFAPGTTETSISAAALQQMGREYLAELQQLAPDVSYVSDKMPTNYRYLGLVRLMLPQAKIIHVMREPMDSCFSCYATLFAELNDYSYDLQSLGRHYRRYETLMAHWHTALPAGSILDVRYEDIIAAPERETRRLLEYLELPWDDACLNFHENRRTVRTASLAQVRQPLYSASIARWKRFEKHLGPLLEIVGNKD